MTSARDLADRFHQRWLTENPFAASMYGIPGYDDLMPDESEEGAQAWRAEVEGFLAEEPFGLGPPRLRPLLALVRDQVVVPGNAVHAGRERVLGEPALMEAIG